MGFEYKAIDLNQVRSVDIVPLDDAGYRSFMSGIYDSDNASETMYEQWANQYPELADEYKRLADKALSDPERLADDLDDEIFEGLHDQLKEMHNDLRYVVRYPDQADRYDLWVYDGDEPDRLVHRCTYGLIDELRGRCGKDEQRKACLKYAYTLTFETSSETPNVNFNLNREEGMLRHLESDHAKAADIGSGGLEFESRVRETLSDEYGLELRDPVFRIRKQSGDILYKVMDCHTRMGSTPIILEMFTQRVTPYKQEQLENYMELYHRATGFQPDGYLVTEKAFEMVKSEDGEYVVKEQDKDRWGAFTLDYFLEHIESHYGVKSQ